jgi:outer membrane protein
MKMRRIVCLAACFLLFSIASARAAGDVVAFDLQKVARECDALKVAIDALEKKYGGQKDELEKERNAIEKKGEEYTRKKPTDKQQKELDEQRRKYMEKAQAFMRLYQADEMRVRTDIDTVILAAAKDLAARKGYAMVLDTAAVPYVSPGLDVTNDMITEANEVWKKMNSAGQESSPQSAPQTAPPANQ